MTGALSLRRLENPVERLRMLARNAESRVILAVAGYPGSGKSTLCHSWESALNDDLGPGSLVVLGTDGFHLPRAELKQMADPDEAMRRRGAPYTFDPDALVRKLVDLRRSFGNTDLGWPGFRHEVGDPEPDARRVPAHSRLIIVEGIYTMMREDSWKGQEKYYDECWFVDVSIDEAMSRLVERHRSAWGMTRDEARRQADGNDRLNCRHIRPGRELADFLVDNPRW